MSKTIVYSKQPGELPVPVTIRVEWLPDGTIKPLAYWTPEGYCFIVRYMYSCTQLAFLKNRGEGIRFKVKAELIETPEYDDGFLHALYETYLYLSDNWFCGKNIIDERYGHARKEYIPMTLDIFPDMEYELVSFTANEERYMVEKTCEIEPRGSFEAGGIGICHKVEARRIDAEDSEETDSNKHCKHTAEIYFEINKWFSKRSS